MKITVDFAVAALAFSIRRYSSALNCGRDCAAVSFGIDSKGC